jgi:hypothetical protein
VQEVNRFPALSVAARSAQCEAPHAEADWALDIAVAAARQLESETESSVPEFQDSEAQGLHFLVALPLAAELSFAAAEPEVVVVEHLVQCEAPHAALAAQSVAVEAPFAAARPEAVAAEHFVAARNCVAAEKVADLEVVGNCAAVPGRCASVPVCLAGLDVGVHLNALGRFQAPAFA